MPGLIPSLINLFQNIRDPDKQKREAALAYFGANPDKWKELANSTIADDPKMVQQIFGSNARFGGNNNAVSDIQNNLTRQPLSDTEQVNRLAQLGTTSLNDISNPSKGLPQLRAVRGQDIDPSKIGSGENAFLNPQQQDVRAKFLGLPTAREKQESDLRIDRGKQAIEEGKQNLQKGEQELKTGQFSLEEAQRKSQEDIAKLGRVGAARKFITQNKTTPYTAYKNPNTPAEIKQGFFEDPGMKGQFEAEQDQSFKDAQIKLQKDAASSKHDLDFLLQKSRVDYATKVGEKFGADPEAVVNAMKWIAAGQKLDDLISNQDNLELQKGAIALKSARDLMPQQQVRAAAAAFDSNNKDRFDEVNDVRGKNLDDAHKVAVINQINQDARTYFGSMGLEPPVWGYGKEGDKTRHTFMKIPTSFKDAVPYLVSPGDAVLGYTLPKEKEDKKTVKGSELPEDVLVQKILDASPEDFAATMADKRLDPKVRLKVLQARNKK